jgi:hypothetical protein
MNDERWLVRGAGLEAALPASHLLPRLGSVLLSGEHEYRQLDDDMGGARAVGSGLCR